MLTRIDRMHYSFGYGTGFCHECPHFKKECWNKKATKRLVGFSKENEAIYEQESYIACGLINKPYPNDNEQIQGQLMMDI